MNGFLSIYKPKGMTSHDVINIARKQLQTKKIGHIGTLDPLAEGLLILLVGKAVKLSQYLMTHDKVYRFGILLGAETISHDDEMPLINYIGLPNNTPEEISSVIMKYLGPGYQKPPIFSAIKINGTKLCTIARRAGYLNELDEESLQPRQTMVYSVNIERLCPPYIQLMLKVSGGFYIRSLARDIGRDLGCGAYVILLKRIAVGDFTLQNAIKIPEERITPDRIIPIDQAPVPFIKLYADEIIAKKIMNGLSFLPEDINEINNNKTEYKNGFYLFFDKENSPLCISEFNGEKFIIKRGLFS